MTQIEPKKISISANNDKQEPTVFFMFIRTCWSLLAPRHLPHKLETWAQETEPFLPPSNLIYPLNMAMVNRYSRAPGQINIAVENPWFP